MILFYYNSVKDNISDNVDDSIEENLFNNIIWDEYSSSHQTIILGL